MGCANEQMFLFIILCSFVIPTLMILATCSIDLSHNDIKCGFEMLHEI